MEVFKYIAEMGHEQVSFCHDQESYGGSSRATAIGIAAGMKAAVKFYQPIK